MSIPYRTFYRQHVVQIAYIGTNFSPYPAEYSQVHSERRTLYHKYLVVGAPGIWEEWWTMFRGYTEDGWGLPGADAIVDLEAVIRFLPPWVNNVPVTSIDLYWGHLWRPGDLWDKDKASGRYIDGVNPWYVYPPTSYASGSTFNFANRAVMIVDLPEIRGLVYEAWDEMNDVELALAGSANIFSRGMFLKMNETPNTGYWTGGKALGIDFDIQTIILRYFNACCNALTPDHGLSTGGWPMVLTGLGFSNTDAELSSKSGPNNQAHVFNDTMEWSGNHIYIEKPDGTVVATLQPGAPWWDYTVDSPTQVTIPSMPALPAGVYQIRFHKGRFTGVNVDIDSYAGDWRTDPDGRMVPGARLYFYIGEPKKKKPIVKIKWKWKKGPLEIFKYYAPIDVREAATFYEGMVLNISNFVRGTNDLTGLPVFPDLEIELDNTTREFSKLLSEYWCKNQLVEIWYGYQEDPGAFDELIFSGIVSDYDRPGSTWKVRLRSMMEKYFSAKIPAYRCTVEDYPNIHQNHIGREMPEVLGTAVLTEGSAPGAVEAIYIDTSAFKYLAARGSLNAILDVYADGALVAPAGYAITYEDGGKTYITFTADQGDAKITFNAEGYSYSDWDTGASGAGFVQNPAYIILFLLAFFAEVPDTLVDIPAFDTLAITYEDLGFGQDAYLIMQNEKDAATYLQELLFTYGAKLWVGADNKITIGRKAATDYATSLLYFEQIDALAEPQRPQGFDRAANYAPARWRYYPTANLFMGTKIAERLSSILAFDARIGPNQAWEFPWTTSEAMVDLRTTEELLKLGFGDQKIILPLSVEHMGEANILDNFRYQDPYGLDPAGAGEHGHYYYVETITFDLLAGGWTLTGIDSQWMIRQIGILGDSSALPPNWANATEAERIYFYLCDSATCSFADGEPGKVLIDCGG